MSTTRPTLLDVTKRTDPGGNIDMIAEILEESTPILEDMVWKEGNLPTGHRATVRTGYSTPTWRKLNGGVQPTKTTTAQITASCGMLEDYSEVDMALANLNGNSAAWRLSEDRGKIEGIGIELADTLIYGDEASAAEEITGFAALFNDSSANNAENILQLGGTQTGTDQTSIWLVVWGDNVFGIYPKGSKAGLSVTDKGQVTIENAQGASSGRMEAYRTHYKWDCGLMVRDWRYVVRIQFDTSTIVAGPTHETNPDLNSMMSVALRRVPNINAGNAVFYANREVLEWMDIQATVRGNMAFRNVEDAQGKMITRYRGVPVKQLDAILSTEAAL